MAQEGAEFDFVQGDTLSKIRTQFKDKDSGTPVDLTGGSASVHFHFYRPGDNAKSVGFSRAMTITDPVSGKCEYEFQPGDLQAGIMRLESTATTVDGKTISSKATTDFTIRARL